MDLFQLPLLIGLLIGAYVSGSILGAAVVQTLSGLRDVRQLGSGNPGATNMLRHHGVLAALGTLVIDAAKALPTLMLASHLQLSAIPTSAIALAVFIGHLWPLFHDFQGGKGVATAFGIAFSLNAPLAAALLGTWLISLGIGRYSSVAAVITALAAPCYAWVLAPDYTALLGILGMALVVTHRSNIRALIRGEH